MSITKSYNKQTGIYYAYETTYEWSEEKQKKVQRKRCIGQFDPDTGEVVPNGKVGRPSLSNQKSRHRKDDSQNASTEKTKPDTKRAEELISKLSDLDDKARILSEEIHQALTDLKAFYTDI